MALDPSVDIARKVWRPCSYCSNEDGLYLLKADANLVYVQCGSCYTCWWLDTGYGVGKRPKEATDPPQWPA
ncbi:MAG: hypothetical protein ACT4NP_15885 [Pseudonocardiales bacterium]